MRWPFSRRTDRADAPADASAPADVAGDVSAAAGRPAGPILTPAPAGSVAPRNESTDNPRLPSPPPAEPAASFVSDSAVEAPPAPAVRVESRRDWTSLPPLQTTVRPVPLTSPRPRSRPRRPEAAISCTGRCRAWPRPTRPGAWSMAWRCPSRPPRRRLCRCRPGPLTPLSSRCGGPRPPRRATGPRTCSGSPTNCPTCSRRLFLRRRLRWRRRRGRRPPNGRKGRPSSRTRPR